MNFRLYSVLAAAVLLMPTQPALAQTLDQTLAAAYAHDRDLKSAIIDTRLAREAEILARSERRVRVTAGANALTQSRATDRAFAIDDGETLLLQGQVDASIPIYTGGRLKALILEAEERTGAADAGLDSRGQGVLLGAVSVHMEVLLAAEVVRIRERNVDRLEDQSEAARKRFDAGVVTRTDVARAAARFSGADAELAGARADLEAAEARYLEQTGTAPIALSAPDDRPPLPETLEAAIASALARNPRIEAAKRAERAEAFAIDAAKSRRKPEVAFGITGTLQDGSWDNNFRDSDVLAGFRATMPFYLGGALGANERAAILRKEQAFLALQRTRDLIVTEVVESRLSSTCRRAVCSGSAGRGSSQRSRASRGRDRG